MKKTNSKLFGDVEALLEQSVLAEASAKVWERFEAALGHLEPESAELLSRHFQGASLKELSRCFQLSEGEVEALLTKTKRELVNHLRWGFQVRQ